MLRQYCVESPILDPAKQLHLNVASILYCKVHFRSCQAVSPQCCVARSILDPAKQFQLNVPSILCCKSHFRSCQVVPPQCCINVALYKVHFRSCQAVSTQCCINIVLQVPFQILPSSSTSMLHQYCVARPILDPTKQFQLNVASILCSKSHFRSCQAVSPQCCIHIVLQVPF